MITRNRLLGRVGSGGGIAAGAIAAACAVPGQTTQPRPGATAEPVKLTYATDWSGGARGEIMKEGLSRFSQAHPRIGVDRHDIGGDYFEKIAGDFAAGTQDDVIIWDGAQFAQFRDAGSFVDLTAHLRAAKIDPAKTYTTRDPVFWGTDKSYVIPFQLTLGAWYVNKTLFRQEGLGLPTENWTWNEWAAAATKLTKPEKNQYGLGPAIGTNPQVSLLPLIISNGSHHLSPDFKQTQVTAPATLEAVRWVAERVTRDRSWVAPGVSGVGFANGNVAMGWGNTGSIGSASGGFVQSLADKFEWDLMLQPRSPRTGKSVTTYNEQPHAVTNKKGTPAARVDAAFTFVTYLAGKDVQSLVAAQRGSTPVLRELLTSAPYTSAPPDGMRVVAQSAEAPSDMRFFNGYLEWLTAYAKELVDVWSGTIGVDAGAQRANEAGNAVLARAGRK